MSVLNGLVFRLSLSVHELVLLYPLAIAKLREACLLGTPVQEGSQKVQLDWQVVD